MTNGDIGDTTARWVWSRLCRSGSGSPAARTTHARAARCAGLRTGRPGV